jgi:predicted GNAT family acetyltransferase
MGHPVQDNPDKHRFEIIIDGEVGGFAAYHVRDGAVVITHTQIDPEHRGGGVAAELARQTLDTLRDRGVRVLPSCPYFAAYIVNHPEYADLVDL